MTDKEQIMIDGVDVSECVFYQSNFEEDYDVKIKHFCSNWHNSCESVNNSNCYYKQLARKSQEYEQLEEKYEALKLENQEGYEIVAELKHECEELKKQLKTSEKWRINAESLNEKFDIKNTHYRKALEEIEEHYEKVVKNLTTYDDSYDANISIEALHNISDIINKAKGDNNENT